MRFHPEHLDNALDEEGGNAYALPGPQGDFKHAIGQSIRKGNHVIIITANFEAKDLMDKLKLDEKDVTIIDWYSYQTRSIVGIEEEGNILYCARDLMNVNMAVNKAIKNTSQYKNRVMVIDAIPAIISIFGIDHTYTFLSKHLAKLGAKSITSFFLATQSFFANPKNRIIGDLLELLPEDWVTMELGIDVPDPEIQTKKPEISKYEKAVSKVLDNLGIHKEDLGDFHEFGIWLCFECGAFVDQDAKECPTCHSPVELVIHTDEKLMTEVISKCTECGVPVHADTGMCNICGHIFSEEDRENMLGQGLMGIVQEMSDEDIGFVVCQDCGSFVNRAKDNCGLCGAIIDHEKAQEVGSEEQVADELAGLLVTELEFDDELEAAFEERSFIMCPECSASVDSTRDKCAICGYDLTGVDTQIPDIGKAAMASMEKTSIPRQKEQPSAADKYWYKEESELYLCPNCGSFISSKAESCETCGVVFETEEDTPEPIETILCPECQAIIPASMTTCPKCSHRLIEEKDTDEFWIKEQKGLFMCPMCGTFLPDDATLCASCGVEFESEDEEHPDEVREKVCPECSASIAPGEEKCGICGHDIDIDGFWFKKQKGLFMCPSCGTFLAEDVTGCHNCGIVFDSGEEVIETPESNVCPNCMAELTPGDKTCSICGLDFTAPGEVEDIDGFWYKETDELFICPECGAFISASSSNCLNCGILFDDSVNYERVDESESKNIDDSDADDSSLYLCPDCGTLISANAEACPNCGMDFVDETSYDPDKEIEELNLMLVLDEPVETITQPLEAVAADADQEIQELTDMLVSVDEIPGYSADEELDMLDAEIDDITDMLVLDEIVHKELTEEILDDAGTQLDEQELLEAEEISNMLIDLEEPYEEDAGGLKNSLIAHRERGMGMTNGRTNGMTNGIGRTNGMTNGLTNGMTNGIGRTNGMTNGLTNGMTNGLGPEIGKRSNELKNRRRSQGNMYRIAFVVILIAMISILPPLAGMFESGSTGPVQIDGVFSDWDNYNSYYDSLNDQVSNPGINLVESRALFDSNKIYAFLEFQGTVLGGQNEGVDSILIFVDLDGDDSTGYVFEGMGADLVADIYGWDNSLSAAKCLVFDNTRNKNDWNGFHQYGSSSIAIMDSRMEIRIPVPATGDYSMENARMSIMSLDSSGESDTSDFIIACEMSSVEISVNDIAPDTISKAPTPLLEMKFIAQRDDIMMQGLNITVTGDAGLEDLEISLQRFSQGLPTLDGQDIHFSVNAFNSKSASLMFNSPISISLNARENMMLAIDLNDDFSGNTVGIQIDGVIADLALSVFRNNSNALHNNGQPQKMSIDGAFGDWASATENLDPVDDVQSKRNNSIINDNVDIVDIRAALDGELHVFMSVNGNMLGGSTMPVLRTRPVASTATDGPVPVTDSDRDTVPDYLDLLPQDFNNNGIDDASENGDIDSDGILDYDQGGTDYWLNTTIPGNYAPTFANKNVSIYVGPMTPKENFGYDSAYVLIDSDDDPMTGVIMRGGIGIDHVVLVQGKSGEIFSSQCFAFDSGLGDNPWVLLGNINSAQDRHRMELSIDFAGLGIYPNENFTIYAALEDWEGDRDVLDNPLGSQDIEIFAPLNTRAQDSDLPMAAKPKIDITKIVDQTTAEPGDVLMYTITFSVTKNTAFNVVLTETYPVGITFLDANPAPTTGDDVWDFGTLASGDSGTIFINVTVDLTVNDGDWLNNTATMDWTDNGWWSSYIDATSSTQVVIPEFGMGSLSGILIMSGIFLVSRRFTISRRISR